uniref:Uncharacterized protein n=1 Tax=Cyclopterus lumpus TaxID=8103 RepID=A0A8C2WMF0_CYCLU
MFSFSLLCGVFFQDSVICLEEDQTAPGKSKRRKPLRSLNEVLGKASVGKETKAVPGNLSHSKILIYPNSFECRTFNFLQNISTF